MKKKEILIRLIKEAGFWIGTFTFLGVYLWFLVQLALTHQRN